ncbi:MAG: hypothetical protein M3N43_07520 [Actinomycetota bacterium]|nr:hypothetical protein [Actinomycetota bacterium]
MTSVSDILARRRPLEKRVRLLLDGTANAELEDLRRQIKVTKTREAVNSPGLATKVPELERRLTELALQAEEASAEFTFQAISRAALEELKRKHPPTAGQWERYREQVRANMFVQAPDFDWSGLAPALLAACATQPTMTVDEAARLWDELSDGEAAQLFEAAWSVNEQTSSRPFSGTDTAMTPNSGPDSTTPQSEESPSLSLAEGS